MSITEKQQAIIDEFAALESWEDRYKSIIERGRKLPDMPEELKTDKNIVKGCQSVVWLHATPVDGRVKFQGDSDAMIVRGLIALLLEVYSGATPGEILATPADFINETGLGSHLSQTRANGLASMVKQINMYAAVLKAVAG